jgi:hypothetical protein
MRPPPRPQLPGPATLDRLLLVQLVQLDANTQLASVVEHHASTERRLVFWSRRIEWITERCYYLRAGVGWCDDKGPLELRDRRVMMLAREAVSWKNRQALDSYTEVSK